MRPWRCVSLRTCAEKLLVKADEQHDIGFGKRHFVRQLARALERLFHPQSVHRKAAVVGDSMRSSSFPERFMHRPAGVIRHVELPAKLARIGHSEGQQRVAGNRDVPRRKPAEAGVGKVGVRAGFQHLARPGAAQGQRRPGFGTRGDFHVLPGEVVAQVVDQDVLEERGADKVVALGAQARDRGFELDPSAPVQHVRQRHRSVLGRQPVRDQAIQETAGLGTGDLDFRERRDVHEADPLADRPHFLANHVVHDVPAEGVVVALRDAVSREPAGPFKAEHLLVHRALCKLSRSWTGEGLTGRPARRLKSGNGISWRRQ